MPMVRSSDNLLGWFATLLVLIMYLASASAVPTGGWTWGDLWGDPREYMRESYDAFFYGDPIYDMPTMSWGILWRMSLNVCSWFCYIVASNIDTTDYGCKWNTFALSVLYLICATIDGITGGWASSLLMFCLALFLTIVSDTLDWSMQQSAWDHGTRTWDFIARIVLAPWLIAVGWIAAIIWTVVCVFCAFFVVKYNKTVDSRVRGVYPAYWRLCSYLFFVFMSTCCKSSDDLSMVDIVNIENKARANSGAEKVTHAIGGGARFQLLSQDENTTQNSRCSVM